jgi:hypothetical protein
VLPMATARSYQQVKDTRAPMCSGKGTNDPTRNVSVCEQFCSIVAVIGWRSSKWDGHVDSMHAVRTFVSKLFSNDPMKETYMDGQHVCVTAADTELGYRSVAQGSDVPTISSLISCTCLSACFVRFPLTLLFPIGSTWHEMATVTQWLCVR